MLVDTIKEAASAICAVQNNTLIQLAAKNRLEEMARMKPRLDFVAKVVKEHNDATQHLLKLHGLAK